MDSRGTSEPREIMQRLHHVAIGRAYVFCTQHCVVVSARIGKYIVMVYLRDNLHTLRVLYFPPPHRRHFELLILPVGSVSIKLTIVLEAGEHLSKRCRYRPISMWSRAYKLTSYPIDTTKIGAKPTGAREEESNAGEMVRRMEERPRGSVVL